MKRIPVSVRFFLMKMLQYSITTSFSSFVLAYLKAERGLSDSQASLMLMLNTIGAFLGQLSPDAAATISGLIKKCSLSCAWYWCLWH